MNQAHEGLAGIAPQETQRAEENRTRSIKAYSRYGIGLLVFLLSQLLLPMGVKSLIFLISPDAASDTTFDLAITYACMYLVGFPLLLLIMKGVPKNTAAMKGVVAKKMKPWALIGLFFISFAVLTLTALGVSFIEQLIGSNATVSVEDLTQSATPQWMLFLAGVVIAPTMEEMIFRKIGYNRVSGYGAGLYIVWTAIMFGLLHLNLGQSIYAMFLGFIFAKITYDTGTVKYAIIIHVLCNACGGIGIGSILMRTGDELLIGLYGTFVMALTLIGVVLIIVFLVKFRSHLRCAPVDTTGVAKKRAFLNVGTILYCLVTLTFIVLGTIGSMIS